MKRIQFSFSIILVLLLTILSSCGSDDNDNRSSHIFKATCEAKYPIRGYAGDKVTADSPMIFSINDMLKNYDFQPPVVAGKLYPNKNTTFEIVGLKTGISIKEITIVLNGLGRTYKNINSENANFYTADLVDFMNRTFNKMVSSQRLSVLVSFTLNHNITEEDNVYVKISYDGEFTYLK